MTKNNFELLLPVGQKEMALAAIHNGADAIFVGFPGFNARGRSYDFELQELKEIIETCHLYGVKVNLAFNIVIFENELPKVIDAIQNVLPLNPDALIIQDLGLVQIVRQMCPEQTIHASTQMTITNDLAISLLDDLGIKRFVLGRENSLSEIKLIASKTNKDLEVFVHGALCVSYSGQCFTSETIGGRSANRGQCAQSCRLSYDLIVDGEKRNLVDKTYLVSPQDLCGLSEIPELIDIGVKSFKVEGRLKTPEYVASVARSFRKMMDSHLDSKRLSKSEIEKSKKEMALQFSRGFFPGWLHGVNHQELVPAKYSAHRGQLIGRIHSYTKSTIEIESKELVNLKPGDGLLWFDKNEKTGSLIYSVEQKKGRLIVGIANSVALSDFILGSEVYLNHDQNLAKDLEKSFTQKDFLKKIPLQLEVNCQIDQPLQVLCTDGTHQIHLQTESVLQKAEKKPVSKESLFEELSSLGGSPFSLDLEHFTYNWDQQPYFISNKEIKKIRQNFTKKLIDLRKSHKVNSVASNQVQNLDLGQSKQSSYRKPDFHILLRTKDQVDDLCLAIESSEILNTEIQSVCLDFEFGRDYSKSLEKLKSLGIKTGLATTRILKPQEYVNLKIIHSLNPDFILIRNLGALYYFNHIQKFENELRGDFSLNVTNQYSFNYLKSKGLSTINLSYDMNFEQSMALLQNISTEYAEITIHQNMPSFHMEHCVFAAFLSQGRSYKDCGKPCEKHKVQLKDQLGNYHWIKPDHECRNTMYNSSSQTALPYLPDWMNLGLGHIRFEALHEQKSELIFKIKKYIDYLNGALTIENTLKELKTNEAFGLSPRQLARKDEYQSRKKNHSFINKP